MRTKSLFIVFACCFIATAVAQTTAIPDTNFEQFLVDQGIDTNGLNGNILNADAEAVTVLNLTVTTITDITGINAFTNVTDLDLRNNQIATVAPTALTQLRRFRSRDNEVLNALDFTQNTALEVLDIRNVAIGSTIPITVIDLSQNTNLITVEVRNFGNLSDLIFPSTNTLNKVFIIRLADAVIDLSMLGGLEDLDVISSSVAVEIILPSNPSALRELYLAFINIPDVDVSNFINLERLELIEVFPETLVLPSSNSFERLTIVGHDFQVPVSLATIPMVKYVDIRGFTNTIPLEIDVTSNPLIETLRLGSNEMTSIDLTQNTNLERLNIDNNDLTSLDVTQNLLIEDINANSNVLPSIDVTQNFALRRLRLNNNQLPNLDVTQNVELRTLFIDSNLFTGAGLDLTNNTELLNLSASDNQIESLDITQNTILRSLDLDYNLFTGVDIINQFYNIRSNQGGLSTDHRLILNNNLLEGQIPNLYNLYNPDITVNF